MRGGGSNFKPAEAAAVAVAGQRYFGRNFNLAYDIAEATLYMANVI